MFLGGHEAESAPSVLAVIVFQEVSGVLDAIAELATSVVQPLDLTNEERGQDEKSFIQKINSV